MQVCMMIKTELLFEKALLYSDAIKTFRKVEYTFKKKKKKTTGLSLMANIYVVHQQDRLLLSQLRFTFPSSMDEARSRNRSKLPRPSELDNC